MSNAEKYSKLFGDGEGQQHGFEAKGTSVVLAPAISSGENGGTLFSVPFRKCHHMSLSQMQAVWGCSHAAEVCLQWLVKGMVTAGQINWICSLENWYLDRQLDLTCVPCISFSWF